MNLLQQIVPIPLNILQVVVPFLLGMLLAPGFHLSTCRLRGSAVTFWLAYLPTIPIGAGVALATGQLLSGPIGDQLIAVLVDSSLLFTGANVVYWSLWHYVLFTPARARPKPPIPFPSDIPHGSKP